MQIFLIIDLRTLALLIEYDKIKLMLDKLTHTFKKHFYYFLENCGVLKCFIAFQKKFVAPCLENATQGNAARPLGKCSDSIGVYIIKYFSPINILSIVQFQVINDKSH